MDKPTQPADRQKDAGIIPTTGAIGLRICGGVLTMLFLFSPGCREPNAQPRPPDPDSELPPTSGAVPVAKPRLPRTSERADERAEMVRGQIANRGITDEAVLAAMRSVPRHWFVPDAQAGKAYEDRPLPIGWSQTISQPYIVALMTEALGLKPGEKVLEVGTGSGYQAAVLAELTDRVYTIEIVEPLAKRTIELLRRRGYETIHARISDGYRGWAEEAPFDAIIVTCAPDDPPPRLVEQLAIGGRMCIPVGGQAFGQELILLTKQADGTLKRDNLAPVSFVPMTGEAQGREK